MDSLVSAALEEICARGAGGIPLHDLWPAIPAAFASAGLPTSDAVKRILWGRLLALPGLRFSDRGGAPLGSLNPVAVPLEEAERSGLVIVAQERLRDNFVGLYDRHASTEVPPLQRRALERLAAARTKGVTQRELGKEFGIKGNNMFYIVRNLEYQQLIVRQSTILRATKESGIEGENETENTSIVNTNLIHLRRYAKDTNSNSQQRIEITRTDLLEGIDNTYGTSPVGSGTSRECVKEVVCVKDFLPAMKAICDKLEEANEKVLVVSDIKVGLGYTNSSGHRAWRNAHCMQCTNRS